MNTTGCPPGFATDQVLFVSNPDLSCDTSVAFYIGLATTQLSLCALVAGGQFHQWYLREAAQRNRNGRASFGTRRLPLVPSCMFLFALSSAFLMILSGLNIATKSNAMAPFLYGIACTCYSFVHVAYLAKFISLGHRVIPKIMSPESFSDIDKERLHKYDGRGKVMLALCLLGAFSQTLCFCVLSPILAGNYLIIRLGAGCYVWFTALTTTLLVRHIERVKRV